MIKFQFACDQTKGKMLNQQRAVETRYKAVVKVKTKREPQFTSISDRPTRKRIEDGSLTCRGLTLHHWGKTPE